MKIRKKLTSGALLFAALILFLTFISPVVSANSNQNNSSGVNIIQITNGESLSGNPSIYDDRIVWKNNDGVNIFNITTFTKTQIANDRSPESCMWGPVIYGDTIVWSTWNYNIHTYNLSTSKRTQITTDGSVVYTPAIYKDRIVWVGDGDFSGNLFVYNLSTGKKIQRTTGNLLESPIDIYEDRVVGAEGDLYNISSPEKSEVIFNKTEVEDEQDLIIEVDLTFPVIYRDRIVGWASVDDLPSYDVCMYNLSTHEITLITTNEFDRGYCAIDKGIDIYEDTIVWKADHENSADIYMYNLSTLKETQIVGNSMCSGPSIYGDRIIWAAEHDGNCDIYMCSASGENLTFGAEKQAKNTKKNIEEKAMPGFEAFSFIISLLCLLKYMKK